MNEIFATLSAVADRVLALTEELERVTPPGHPPDPDSPAYRALATAIEEGKASMERAEAAFDERTRAELAGMTLPEPAPAILPPEPPSPAPQPDGAITFAFETEHAPPADLVARLVQSLRARAVALHP